MNLENFSKQVASINLRLGSLYQGVKPNLPIPVEVMPTALKELGFVSEELQVALEELQQQNEELHLAQVALEVQKLRYQELFDLAPNPYLVTDEQGIIQEANHIAATTLNVPQRFLIGKPLIVFIAEEKRQLFHVQLTELKQADNKARLKLRILPRNLQPFNAELLISKISDWDENLVGLRICIYDIEDKLQLQPTNSTITKSALNLQKQIYLKGEIVPIKSQVIWQVCQGLVKLSTVGENGEEVLVGLVGTGMIFGANLTRLQTYQATALSEVQLVSIPWAEIDSYSSVDQNPIAQINQRLHQTEALLAISGQRRVKDRFYQLLQLLKQEIGQKVESGTRLNIRFTHQDFADACSTTRVTITRLVGKLQKEGEIKVDSKNHLILLEQNSTNSKSA
ncbi:PAS domain-containing protein [Chlorogloea sp. CCALA 695]|uniref:PAS domain-containing protein n=1 Tax=Chlorogloea sp. CCALA 695 TaxID=2107693 RepID=UPI000D05EC80|nr:PAS domain-containing protein [Chlorogloea sp. CCALA 695]PSB30287.1 transcriptional regulator [Chlorogloea sp. CCALA 695]